MEGLWARQTCDLYVFDNKSPLSPIRALSPPTTLANSEIELSVSSAWVSQTFMSPIANSTSVFHSLFMHKI